MLCNTLDNTIASKGHTTRTHDIRILDMQTPMSTLAHPMLPILVGTGDRARQLVCSPLPIGLMGQNWHSSL